MTLVDTAEMYGDGATEELVGEALRGNRDRVFLVSKAYPQNASRGRLPAACEASLRRLGTDRLDLYLLHWRGRIPLAETVDAMRALQQAGKIRHWGVSDLDTDDMAELFAAGGDDCATNQIQSDPAGTRTRPAAMALNRADAIHNAGNISPVLPNEATIDDYRSLFLRTGNKVGLQTPELGLRTPEGVEDYHH